MAAELLSAVAATLSALSLLGPRCAGATSGRELWATCEAGASLTADPLLGSLTWTCGRCSNKRVGLKPPRENNGDLERALSMLWGEESQTVTRRDLLSVGFIERRYVDADE
jgi:hypothetical protein